MTLRASLRRPDWLRELHGFLLFAVLLSAVVAATGVFAVLAGEPLDVQVGGEPSSGALSALPPGTIPDPALHLRITEPSAAQMGWAILAGLPRCLLLTAALAVLRRLVARARRGGPFAGGVPGRLRTLGLLLVIGGPTVWALELTARFALSDTVGAGSAYAALDATALLGWLLAGFVAFAAGEVVRRGEALEADLVGVV